MTEVIGHIVYCEKYCYHENIRKYCNISLNHIDKPCFKSCALMLATTHSAHTPASQTQNSTSQDLPHTNDMANKFSCSGSDDY